MRIGIITYWRSTSNYGQILQCYALQQYLKQKGHDVFLIRYAPRSNQQPLYLKFKHYIKCHSIKELLLTPFRVFLVLINKKKNKEHDELRDFSDFKKKHIISTLEIYHNPDDLKYNNLIADVFITGSDQVWQSSLLDLNSTPWYLQFGPPLSKRVSYAVSIGREFKKEELPILFNYLRKFDAVSVRELQLCDFLNNHGINSKVVLDPTLLLDFSDYRKLFDDSTISNKYIFIYYLNVRKEEEICLNEIKQYAVDINLPIKCVSSSGYIPAKEFEGINYDYPTIQEWIKLIYYADSVITTSYHGVVFSILMHRPFISILLSNHNTKGNDRTESLLKMLGIENRIFNPQLKLKEQMDDVIDWNVVDNRLSNLRTESINFLNKSLGVS